MEAELTSNLATPHRTCASGLLEDAPTLVFSTRYGKVVVTDIVKLERGDEPSVDTNHVVIRLTIHGSYQASGSSNKNGKLSYLLSRHDKALDDAVSAAKAWGDEHGINVIQTYLVDEQRSPEMPRSLNLIDW